MCSYVLNKSSAKWCEFWASKVSRYVGFPIQKIGTTFFPYKMLAFGSVPFGSFIVLVSVLYCGL